MNASRRAALLFGLSIFATLAMAWLALALGSRDGAVVFDPTWFLSRREPGQDLLWTVLWELRAPRVVAALVVGAALATAGLLLQGVTRNPLADPYLLGVSGGAGLVVVALHALLPGLVEFPWAIPLAAFIGASGAMLAVLQLARGSGGRLSLFSLILAGVVINAFCAALITFFMARFDPHHLRITSTWLYGGLGFTRWGHLVAVAALVFVGWVFARAQAHRLNAFALGVAGAEAVGVDGDRLLLRAALLSSLLAALCVSLAGLLGYVGLIVPHGVRLLVGNDFRRTLSVSAVSGALLLLLADTAARLILAPEELPVGVLTALVGCPVLLWQLRSQLTRRSS
ncbi:MAG: iron ABC transporter permease [Deltaproteobacteria bacterium]|nr:iron ABC transporter permease [Deltaproteobacteria bacterium]